MTQDEIFDEARASGLDVYALGTNHLQFLHRLEVFTKRILDKHKPQIAISEAFMSGFDSGAEVEREECAKLCDERLDRWAKTVGKNDMYKWMKGLSKLIRERGQE